MSPFLVPVLSEKTLLLSRLSPCVAVPPAASLVCFFLGTCNFRKRKLPGGTSHFQALDCHEPCATLTWWQWIE